jgi:hypothetical protein
MATGLKLLERACPTCGGLADGPAPEPEVASRKRAENLNWDELRPYWDHFFKEKVFFSYSRCPGCGLLYCPKYFDHKTLADLYGESQHGMIGVPLDALKRTQRGYFEVLKRHSPLEGDYLEIGPGSGLFTDFCAREGRFDRFWLFEPSRLEHETLAGLIAGRQFEIHTEMFTFDAIPERSISVAVIIHVLDHLIDPKDALEELRARLTGASVVLIVTHDESSFLAKVLTHRWPPYCLPHPQLFRASSMRKFLESAGYKVLETRKTYNHFPVTYLFKHSLSALGVRSVKVPQWNSLVLPLKLGNIITIAAPSH